MFEIDNPDEHCQPKVVVCMIILQEIYTFPSISPIHILCIYIIQSNCTRGTVLLRWSSLSAMCIGAVFLPLPRANTSTFVHTDCTGYYSIVQTMYYMSVHKMHTKFYAC